MLVHEPAGDVAVDEIVSNPVLHAEVKAALPALVAHAAPCGDETVVGIVGKLFAVFPQPDRSAAEWAAFWEAYTEDLADLPLEALEAAVRDYRRSGKAEFLPKPGPLRELAIKHAQPIRQAAYRAKRAAESLPRRPRVPDPRVAEMLAEIASTLKPVENVRPPLPATHGKTGERATTPAMRAWLAKREGGSE